MGLLDLVYWLLRRRIRHSWVLLALTAFGVLAAVTLMATGSLYSRVLGEAGIRHSLASLPPTVVNTLVVAQDRPLGPADYEPLSEMVQGAARSRLSGILEGIHRFGRTQLGLPGDKDPNRIPRPQDAINGRPFFMTGFQDHSRLVAGSWPESPGSSGPEGVEIDAVVGASTARTAGYEVGTKVFVWPFPGDPSERIVLNITGLAEPIDPSEVYWMGPPNYFSVYAVADVNVAPFYLTEQNFLQVLGSRFPTLVGDFGFNLFLDPSRITAGDADAVQEAMAGLETDVNKRYPRTFVLSRLSLAIDEYKQELTLARVPLYVFVSLFVIVIIYFLVLITGLLGRSQSEEAALLRSRGASVAQVAGAMALAEAVVVLVAVAIGPLIAWLIVRFLLLSTIDPVGGRDFPTGLAADTYWMGAAGGALALVVLGATAVGRARMAMTDSLAARARPPSNPFLLRYYFDVLALLAVGLIWWQVRGRDGFVAQELAARGVSVDPTLVLGPVLGLFAAAVLLMRALPLAARLMAWAGEQGRSAWVSHALVRLARDPVPNASLAVMLMLAAALGVFGATFQSSLADSQRHQALYRTGGDMVVKGPAIKSDSAQKLSTIPGVVAATPVLRLPVNLLDGHGGSANLIALDPGVLAQAAWFREDFSDQGIDELAALLDPLPGEEAEPGILLPTDAGYLGVWVNTSEMDISPGSINLSLWAHVRNVRGAYRSVGLGSLIDSGQDPSELVGWRFLSGELPEGFSPDDRPLELVGLFVSGSSFTKAPAARLFFDDVTVFSGASAGDGSIIEDFESARDWQPLVTPAQRSDSSQPVAEAAHSGNRGLAFSWDVPLEDNLRGIHIPPGPLPIPVIGGPTFRVGQELRVTQGRLAVPVRVVATTRYFPTVASLSRPLLLIGHGRLRNYQELLPGRDSKPAEEIWLALDPAADREQVSDEVAARIPGYLYITDREKVADLAGRNPLAGGGWNGLTALGMVALGVAAALGLWAYAIISVRQGRTDLAVARAIGFSRGQLLLSLSLERLLMAALAIAAGAAIGFWPGLMLLRMMDFTTSGLQAVPPMVPAVQSGLLAGVLGGLAGAAVISVLFTVYQARRLDTAETLREGG